MAKQINDPGIGTKFDENVRRVINADGSYNVYKKGTPSGLRDAFRYLVDISWGRFFLLLFSGYVGLNLIFTCIYLLFGFENIAGIDPAEGPIFMQAFFFSIQTFTTVGYGTLAPLGVPTQTVAAIEAFVGFLSFSLATGLLYGRFSKPDSKILFADKFVYSKFETGQSFKFKFTNTRDSVLQDVNAKVICMFNRKNEKGEFQRAFFMLPLTLPRIEIMALTWTIVHKIDEESPFWEKSKEEIMEMHPEFLIVIDAYDELYANRTRSRKSYVIEDIIWNKNFATIFESHKDGRLQMDIRDINNVVDE